MGKTAISYTRRTYFYEYNYSRCAVTRACLNQALCVLASGPIRDHLRVVDVRDLTSVGYNVPFLSFVLSLSSHIVGFIKELSSQLSFQLLISGNLPHGKLLQLP